MDMIIVPTDIGDNDIKQFVSVFWTPCIQCADNVWSTITGMTKVDGFWVNFLYWDGIIQPGAIP